MKELFEKLSKQIEVNFTPEENLKLARDEQRRVNLINYLGLIAIVNMIVYVVIYCFVDFQFFAPAIYYLSIAAIFNFVIIWINNRRKHCLAKLLLSFITPLNMLYTVICFGKEPGFQVYLFVAAIIPLLLWGLKDKKYSILIITPIIFTYVLIEFLPNIYEPWIVLPESYIDVFRKTNVLVCFTVAGIAILIYRRLFIKTEKQLIIQSEKLRITQKQKDKIYSIIGHDLRGPIGSFVGLTEIIINKNDQLSENDKLSLMHSIHNSSVSMQNLLENLLDWSRVQSSSKKVNLRNFSLLKKINESLGIHKDMIQEKHLKIINNISENVVLNANENMVSTILRNLISNSIKFTPENGKIVMSAIEQESEFEICVEDSGIGLSEADINNLFDIEKVYKVISSSEEKGSGLGLILCKDFVEAHGGKLWIESKVSAGSKFYFTLPKKKT